MWVRRGPHWSSHCKRRGLKLKGCGLVGQSTASLEEKAARLLDVSTRSAGLRGAMKVPATLKPQLPIAGAAAAISEGSLGRDVS